MPWLRYVLIAFAGVLVSVISLLIYKYRKVLSRKETMMGKEDVLGRLFLRKLRKVEEVLGKEDIGELFKKVKRIMRSFFSELFEIRYQFDYVELNEELTKKGVKEGIRQDVISYTMDMSKAEYGGNEITDEDFHILLEKSIRIVSKVTGHEQELAAGKVPIKVPEEKKEVIKKEEEIEKKIEVPKDEEDRLGKLRSLLIDAEQDIRENDHEGALESYSELKEIYDSLTPKVKDRIYDETRRIIQIYNALLKEYKDTLTGKK
jgi:hypothetical protein